MGSGLAKLNEFKKKVNNTIAVLKGEEPETGYLGSAPIKFPKIVLPKGCKQLDLRAGWVKIPEIYKITIYECLDELKDDGSYRFSGIEIVWKCKMSGQDQRVEHMVGEKDRSKLIEFSKLDYLKKVVTCTKEHAGVEYVSFLGLQSHLTEPGGVGDLKGTTKIQESTNKEFTEGAIGIRLVVHKKLKVIVDVIPYFSRVSDKKTVVDETRDKVTHSFLKSYKDIQALYGTKIYNYRGPENKYEEFTSFVTNGKMDVEYLGGLPIRFLCPEEKIRFNTLTEKLGLQPLYDLLKKNGTIHHLKIDQAMQDKVVNFICEVLQSELFNSSGGDYETNIRFCMKMLCIVYNDDEALWKKVVDRIGDGFKKIGASLFDKALDACKKDPKLEEVQFMLRKDEKLKGETKLKKGEEVWCDKEVKKLYQKACPQCPDEGEEDDLEKIAKLYMLDAAEYLQEFHATFLSMFPTNDAHYHGASTVKGLDRIKAKALEEQEEAKKKVEKIKNKDEEELKKLKEELDDDTEYAEILANPDKLLLSNSDAIAKTMDFLRGTVTCKNLENVLKSFKKIREMKGDYEIVRIKNNFVDVDKKKDFKKIILNIKIFNLQIAEVQITIKDFKEGNTMNHFLYEMIREHCLYDIVAKNLNLSNSFKEWVEPMVPDTMYEIWPKNQSIHLKGYLSVAKDENDIFSSWTHDPKKRQHISMNITTDKDYKLGGSFFFEGSGSRYDLTRFGDDCKVKFPNKVLQGAANLANALGESLGLGKVGNGAMDALDAGKKFLKNDKFGIGKALGVDKVTKAADAISPDESYIEWKMRPVGGGGMYGGGGGSMGCFKGKFLDDQMIEGTFEFIPLDPMTGKPYPPGKQPTSNAFGTAVKEYKGTFRLWVDDAELPGLNAGLLAYKEVMKTSRIIRKKNLPHKAWKWEGILGSSKTKKAKKGEKAEVSDDPLDLKLKIQNPSSYPWGMGITGSGKLGANKIDAQISGFHNKWESVRITFDTIPGIKGCFGANAPRHIVCTGRFVEDLKIAGSYEEKSHLGRFVIKCVDKNAIKQFGQKGENESGRWELIVIYNDGEKQYNQASLIMNADNTVSGSGFNFDGEFQLNGKEGKKSIEFTKTQKNADGTEEKLSFDGAFITAGVYEGLFRSENSWGKFKLRAI